MSERSAVLPVDPFDQMIARLLGLPNGAHTQPVVRQATDFYGNTTSFMIQTIRHDDGDTCFVTQVNAGGSTRYALPPEVLDTIARQREAVSTMVRRRHGKRLAEERKAAGYNAAHHLNDPEVRKRALESRKAKAAKRRARRNR